MCEFGPTAFAIRVAAQELRRLGVAKDARLTLGEDAVARECAQDAPQGVRICSDGLGDLFHVLRTGSQAIGDVQVCGYAQRLRAQRAPDEIPQPQFGRDLGHERAAATAVAISSASASLS